MKTLRKITRSGFAARLGLYGPDMSRRPNSNVDHAVTRFYDVNGNHLGTQCREVCPIDGTYDDEFHVWLDTDEDIDMLQRQCG